MKENNSRSREGNRVNRRTFASLAAGGLAGSGLLEAAVQETRTAGILSPETARALLEFLGHPPASHRELEQMRSVLEWTVQAIQVIRDFEIPVALEPAFVFRPESPEDEPTP